jgi:uncharacterized Zn finger protein (UPF0148 family)
MARRHPAPLRCKRRGCDRPRRRDDTFCPACWRAVPHETKDAMQTARTARDPHALADLWAAASIAAAAATARTPAADPVQTYTRIAAQLGEHDEAEAAE